MAARKRIHFCTLIAALTLIASPSSALTVRDADPATLAFEADLIVLGHVIETSVSRPRAAGPLWTKVSVAVWRHFKGAMTPIERVERVVDFWLPGGELGNLGTWVPGVPRVRAGDELLLMLAGPPIRRLPLGYRLGLWFVVGESAVRAGAGGRPDAFLGTHLRTPTLPTLQRAIIGAP